MRHMLMLNVEEVAEIIGVNQELALNTIRTGVFSYIITENEILVPHDSLMRWLDDQLYNSW